jgi:hypothetical protein
MVREYVRVRGVRYRCRIRLGSVSGLDPLAEFFHSEVLDYETHIGVLINSFGLPPRVIEDVLVDLLKRGYAVLDARNGRILKLHEPGRGRREFRLGADLTIWQDSVTGALLPVSAVEVYRGVPEKAFIREVGARPYSSMTFLEAPDAHILSELGSMDPQLTIQEAGWIPDSLISKERLGNWDLFLPLSSAEVDGTVISFVDARTLPSWLTRQWSRALQPSRPSVARLASLIEKGREASLKSVEQGVYAGVDMSRLVDSFQGAFFTVLRMSPPPTRRSQLYDLEAKYADVQIRIESAGRVSLYAPSGKAHLREMWESAEAYLLVGLSKLDQKSIEAVVSATVGQGAHTGYLIIVGPSAGSAERISAFSTTRGDVIVMFSKDIGVPECCIRDGVEVRFGTLKKLEGKDQLLSVSGRGALEIVLGRISEAIHGQPGSTWVSRRLWHEGRRSAFPAELQEISLCLGSAVETLRGNLGVVDEQVKSTATRDGPLADRLPELRDSIEALCFSLPSRFGDLADAYRSTEGRAFAEVVAEAIRNLQRGATPGPLLLVSAHWEVDLATPEFVSLLLTAAADHVCIQIVVAGADRLEQAQERLGEFRGLIGRTNVSIARCSKYLPDMIVHGDYVAVFLGQSGRVECNAGFVAAAKGAAHQIRSIVTHADVH